MRAGILYRSIMLIVASVASVASGLLLVRIFGYEPQDTNPGLWLTGNVVAKAEVDWAFTSKIEEIMVETRTRYWIPHSIITYCAVYRGDLYLLSAYYEGGGFPQARRWSKNVICDPGVRLKIQSDIFERGLRFLGNEASKEFIHDAFLEKYKDWQSPGLENVHIFLVETETLN